MDTASFHFVLFGLATAVFSNLSNSRVWRSIVLSAASALLIGLLAHSLLVLLPLLGFLLVGYATLSLLQDRRILSRAWSVMLIVLAYAWLKKYTFLPEAGFLHSSYFIVGLSYIFFRVLHLLIEAGEAGQPRVSLGGYLLYTLNFTTLVSGPIQRYDQFAEDQFATAPIALPPSVIGLQLERIVRGFFKVNVLAMLFYALHRDALAELHPGLPPSLRVFAAVRVIVLYPFFLYSNFSGYIDLVIAIARLLRVRLPENFDRPFSASSFLDFWNRWHITLSTWLKTYVYNPLLLALMRRNSSPALQPYLGVFCFFVTFFLIGIWHGRTSEFVLFGILQGGGVAINKVWQLTLTQRLGRKPYKALAANRIYIAFGRGLTFTWFAFTLFWFWASWKQISAVSSALDAKQWLAVWLAVWLSATIVLSTWEIVRAALLAVTWRGNPALTNSYARVIYTSTFAVTALVVITLLNQPAPPIVYKAF